MSPELVVFACVLRTIEVGPPDDARCQTPYVHELVEAIQRHSTNFRVPAHIEAALIYHESRYDKRARGSHGEIGLTQPLRHGAIQGRDLKLTIRQLEVVDTNVRIGVQYISQFVSRCKTISGWLTRYNRPARGCRPSRYSEGILTDLRVARKAGQQLSGPPLSWSSPATETLDSVRSSTSAERTESLPDRISRKEPASSPTTPSDSDELRRPAGTRRAVESTPTESKSEEQLAAPFQEP